MRPMLSSLQLEKGFKRSTAAVSPSLSFSLSLSFRLQVCLSVSLCLSIHLMQLLAVHPLAWQGCAVRSSAPILQLRDCLHVRDCMRLTEHELVDSTPSLELDEALSFL